MYTKHTYCRACGYAKPQGPSGIKVETSTDRLLPVFSLGAQPLANDFKKPNEVFNGYVPLEVLFCPKCTLAQLSVVVDPKLLYQNYAYVTSGTQTMQTHFERMWHALCIDAGRELKTVVEIGSNDGKLLKFLKDKGVTAIGIDPAENLTQLANDNGLKTITGFLNPETADDAVKLLERQPDCIIARHVFCHIDDWKSAIRDIASMCGPQTIVAIEVPNVDDLLNAGQFDTVYHEHLSFASVHAMNYLVADTGLGIETVHQYTLHGGVVLMVMRRMNSYRYQFNAPPSITDWDRFRDRATHSIDQLTQTVKVFRSLGKTVAGFGASAKSTVWMNACKFNRKDVDFICDSTPFKIWKYSPGSDVPIVDENALVRERPDYAIMFCWNYIDEVLKTQKKYLDIGGRFIVPIPRLQIIPS